MTKDVLLSTEFDSAYDAMIALNVFLEKTVLFGQKEIKERLLFIFG